MPINSVVRQLAIRVGKKLRDARMILATVESCTGGMVATAITDVAGSSSWFERGFVTYSDQAKSEISDVPAEMIERYGAVSEQVAQAMAMGGLRKSQAQVSLAITGIAGPNGGTQEKPVGMVSFAWSNQSHVFAETLIFKGDREQIREQATAHALRGLLALLDRRKIH